MTLQLASSVGRTSAWVDHQQGKRKAKVIPQERRDFRSNWYNNNQSRRDYVEQSGSNNTQVVGAVFREPVHQVLEKIKNKPFFKWPNKMVENPEKRNHNLYCQYHRDHGHTTEDCRSLWDHLNQFVREGKLKQLLHHSSGLGDEPILGLGERFLQYPLGNYQCYLRCTRQNKIVPV